MIPDVPWDLTALLGVCPVPRDQELTEHGAGVSLLQMSPSLGRGPGMWRGAHHVRVCRVDRGAWDPVASGRNLGQSPRAHRLVTSPDFLVQTRSLEPDGGVIALDHLPDLFQVGEMPGIWGEGAGKGCFYLDLLGAPVPEDPHYQMFSSFYGNQPDYRARICHYSGEKGRAIE